MGEWLRVAADAVTAASVNPLALATLLVLGAAWLVIGLKMGRNRQVLTYLHQLPEKDRLRALQMEMGVVTVRGDLSPEQWLRHNLRTYYFFSLAIVCLTLVILAAMALHASNARLKSGIDVSLHNLPLESVTSSVASGLPQMAGANVRPARAITYVSHLKDSISHITYELPYLELVRRGGLVRGMSYLSSPFNWQFPELSVKLNRST